MMLSFSSLALCFLFSISSINAQLARRDGYVGYQLHERGDPNSVIYDTASTTSSVSTTNPPPDVYLNASVSVAEIDITVQNLTAKINLDASVLSLLKFNAGVDVSIDTVQLLIQNVTAKVLLEARLENLVLMIGDVLNSLDLNPVLATLGQDVGNIVNTTVGGLTGGSGGGSSGSSGSPLSARSYELANNILYSVNDYMGNTHTNRVLAQNGSIIDESLDNNGAVHKQQVVGYYTKQMVFNGHNQTVMVNGQTEHHLEYVYAPFPGLSVVSAIYTNARGAVMATRVLSESGGGGGSTVGGHL